MVSKQKEAEIKHRGRKTREGILRVIHGVRIAKGCLISRGGGFGANKRLPSPGVFIRSSPFLLSSLHCSAGFASTPITKMPNGCCGGGSSYTMCCYSSPKTCKRPMCCSPMQCCSPCCTPCCMPMQSCCMSMPCCYTITSNNNSGCCGGGNGGCCGSN